MLLSVELVHVDNIKRGFAPGQLYSRERAPIHRAGCELPPSRSHLLFSHLRHESENEGVSSDRRDPKGSERSDNEDDRGPNHVGSSVVDFTVAICMVQRDWSWNRANHQSGRSGRALGLVHGITASGAAAGSS